MSDRGCILRTERLSALEKVWSDIFKRTFEPTPFSSYEWFAALSKNLLRSDPEITVFTDDGQVRAILPAMIDDGAIRSLGDQRVTDLFDMVCEPGDEKSVCAAIAGAAQNQGLRIDLFPLDSRSRLAVHLAEMLHDVAVKDGDTCPLLELPGSWDGFLGKLGSKDRHELRRKMKRVNAAALEKVKTDEIHDLYRLMGLSNENKEKFMTPDIVAFFDDLVRLFNRREWLRARKLVLDGRTAAMMLAFTLGERIYLYNMGYDPAFRSLSPGIVAVALDIRSAISEGCRYYDFLRGDEDYKYRLGAIPRRTVRIAG